MKRIFYLIPCFILFSCKLISPSIAFYNVPESLQKEIELSVLKASGKTYKTIILDNDKPITEQTKKISNCTFVFALTDSSVKKFVSSDLRVKPLPSAYLSPLPATISARVPKRQNTIYYLPVAFDFYQIEANFPMYKRSKVPTVDYWNDFLRIAMIERNYTSYPIIFNGEEDENFINIFSMVTEAILGSADYEEAYSFLETNYSKENFPELLQAEITPGGLLYPVILEFQQLLKNKLLYAKGDSLQSSNSAKGDSLRFSFDTVTSIVSSTDCGFYFGSYSEHQKLPEEILNQYKPIYCPAYQSNTERRFVTKEYCLICLENPKSVKQVITTVSNKLNEGMDENVRYWLSASSGALHPLSTALPTPQARQVTAESFRRAIEDITP